MAEVDQNRGKKLLGFFLITLICSALCLTALGLGTFTRFENTTWDFRLQATANPERIDPAIKLIVIDQSSLDYFAREEKIFWQWPRGLYEGVLKFLERAEAKAVAFDILFTEPSAYGVDDDRAFADAVKTAEQNGLPVVNAFALRSTAVSGVSPEAPDLFSQKQSAKQTKIERILTQAPPLREYSGAVLPIPELILSSAELGNVSAQADSDLIFRHATAGGMHNGVPVLNLPFSLYSAAKKESDIAPLPAHLFDQNGRLTLRFHGPAGTYPTYAISAVIKSAQEIESGNKPMLDPALFKDSLVLIGMTAPGLLDLRPTPLSRLSPYPGVEYNATVLDNLLNHRFVRKLSFLPNGLVSIFFIGLATYFCIQIRRVPELVVALIILFVLLIAVGYLCAYYSIWLFLVAPLSSMLLATIMALGFQYQLEGREHRFLKGAFKHYVSPDVIDRIVQNPSSLSLGGEKRELTIFFSDIKGFTSISEKLEATQLGALLNLFLSNMTKIILAEQGTVDKYVGDAIVAFWNAPVETPDHAVRAVRAALRCQERLKALASEFKRDFGTEVTMRVGINTGVCTVGNFGSSERFNYTMIGDAANLASRLEGVNKIFGTSNLISESTYQAVRREIKCRKIADITVVGKTESVSVYEPLAATAFSGSFLIQFEKALKLFEAGDYNGAREFFSKLSDDSAARAFLKRLDSPGTPSPVWMMSEK